MPQWTSWTYSFFFNVENYSPGVETEEWNYWVKIYELLSDALFFKNILSVYPVTALIARIVYCYFFKITDKMGEMVFHCFFNLHFFFLLVRLGKKNLLHIFADNSVIFFKVSFCVLCLTCWVLSVLGVFFLSYYVWLVYIIKILKPCHICCKFFPSLLMKNITFKLDSLLFWKMCKFGTGGL